MKKLAGIFIGAGMMAQAAAAQQLPIPDNAFDESSFGNKANGGATFFGLVNRHDFYYGTREGLDPKEPPGFGADFLLNGRGNQGLIGHFETLTCQYLVQNGGKDAEGSLKAFFKGEGVPVTPDLDAQITDAVTQGREACAPSIS